MSTRARSSEAKVGLRRVHSVKYQEEHSSARLLLNNPQVWQDLHSIEKWTGWDLNPRPLPCQDSDLPADLPARER